MMGTAPLLDLVDERVKRAREAALWDKHNQAAAQARAAGACLRCAAEMGFRATDQPGETRERFKIHLGCLKPLQRLGVACDG